MAGCSGLASKMDIGEVNFGPSIFRYSWAIWQTDKPHDSGTLLTASWLRFPLWYMRFGSYIYGSIGSVVAGTPFTIVQSAGGLGLRRRAAQSMSG